MDVVIHTHNNVKIKLEISFFDTIADIKHQLQFLVGIAASRQSLYHNNAILPDNLNIQNSTILNNSHLNLFIKTTSIQSTQPQNNAVSSLLVQSPLTKRFTTISNNRVRDLKQITSEKEKIPIDFITVFYKGVELDDDETEINDDEAVIEMGLVGNGYDFEQLNAKIVVFVVNVNVKLPMTFNLYKKFSDLRRKLEKLRKENRISLPEDWFFVYGKERVIVEHMVMKKFKVQDGDVFQVWSSSKLHPNTPETPQATTTINVEETSPTPSPKVQIHLKMATPNSPISLEMSPNDTFSKLKDKIHNMEQIPKSRISLNFNNKDLHGQTPLREQEVSVNVMKQSPSTSVGSGSHGASKRLKLMVLYKNGTERIPVEMNVGDNVGDLRKELGKMQERMGFELPNDGYFFIYKQNVMDDDKSFRWHKVGQGDVIEVFSGSVTGGSS